jgi:transposase
VLLHLTAGQVSDHKGARRLLKQLPQVGTLIADRGYDSNWFRNELAAPGIASCIPGRKNGKQAIDYDKALYKQRQKVENMFAKLKDWRRIATRLRQMRPDIPLSHQHCRIYRLLSQRLTPEPKLVCSLHQ